MAKSCKRPCAQPRNTPRRWTLADLMRVLDYVIAREGEVEVCRALSQRMKCRKCTANCEALIESAARIVVLAKALRKVQVILASLVDEARSYYEFFRDMMIDLGQVLGESFSPDDSTKEVQWRIRYREQDNGDN